MTRGSPPRLIMQTDTDALRYPIGRRVPRTSYTAESRAAAIKDIENVPASLRRAVAGLSDAQLDTPYRPGGWTARQVVHHLADAHVVMYARVRMALAEDNPAVTLWDEDRWAELPDSKSMPVDLSLQIVDSVHARFVNLSKMLPPQQFARTLRHPVWGVIPADELVELWAWHGKHHVAHINAVRALRSATSSS